MAIALAAVPESGLLTQAIVLGLVAIGITGAVYGVVAVVVKADDVGILLAKNRRSSLGGRVSRAIGRALVVGMPAFMTFLSARGTAAMIWVGGGIVVHGFEVYGVTSINHAIHGVAEWASHALPRRLGVIESVVEAMGAGIFGLAVGLILIQALNSSLRLHGTK